MIEITQGRLQLVEMVVPGSPSRHIREHLKDIRDLANVIAKLPGSDAVKIVPIPREHSSWTFKVSMAAGLVAAAVSVMAATRDRVKTPITTAAVSPGMRSISQADAALIPLSDQWRCAAPEDFDPAFIAWANGIGQKPSSHFTFDPDGTGPGKGVAYLLVNHDGAKRMVLLLDHHVVFDGNFRDIAGIAPLPATTVAKIQLGGTKSVPGQMPGDGILLVRTSDDPSSAVVFYFQNGKLQSASPSDYRSISLE
jgi:hypothetical protein